MIGKIFVYALVLFLASFVIGTTGSIIKELIRRKRAKSDELKNTKELEGDNRTDQ